MTNDLDGVRWSELQHNYGPAGDVPALLRKLKDRRRWQVALDELDNLLYHQGGWICSASAAAAPFLIELAANRGTQGRVEILEVVGRIAGESRQADPEFVAEEWPAAWEAVLPSLLDLLADPDPAVRCASAVALSSGSDDDRVSRALRTRWDSEDDAATQISLVLAVGDLARARAARALSTVDELTWLRGLVAHRDRRVGTAAVVASYWIAGGDRLPEGDVAVVVASVRASEAESWKGVVQVPANPAAIIGWFGGELRGSWRAQLDLVTALAGDPREDCREGALAVAAGIVARWRSPTEFLVPIIAGRLRDGEREVRALAAHLLAALGEPAAGHADAMAALLRDSSPVDSDRETIIADIAAWGLARFKDPRCLPVLCERLGRRRRGFGYFPEHYTHDYLLWLPSIDEVLAMVSPTAELLAGLHKRMRAARDPDELNALIRAVGAWGPAAQRLTPDLVALLRGDDGTAALAADALGAFGPAASASEPALAELARDSRVPDRLRRRAALAAFRVGGHPMLTLSRLRSSLDSDAADACRMAAALGRDAAAHAPRIRELLAAQDDWTRVEAAHALWRVTGEAAESVSIFASVLDGVADGVAVPVTRAAARYLAAIGPEAAPAVPILRRILADDRRHAYFGGWRAITEDEELRGHVQQALDRAS